IAIVYERPLVISLAVQAVKPRPPGGSINFKLPSIGLLQLVEAKLDRSLIGERIGQRTAHVVGNSVDSTQLVGLARREF
ncbi:hypothetical protein, partial [Enterococcus faecium]|uniref:hypothetical protein n=1 Tax=Enterococcus faecium TaxID=1352 RepID=UPI003F425DEE